MVTRIARSILSLWIVTAYSPMIARADLADDIPANAKVAVLVKDIGQLERDCREFVERLGLPLPIPEIEFDLILQTLGIEGKLGKQGALVVTDPSPAGVTMILEFEDIDAVTQSPGVEPGDEKDTYVVDLMGTRGVALVKGSRVFLQIEVPDAKGLKIYRSKQESLLEALTEDQKKVLANNDVFFTVNVREWRKLALEGLDYAEGELKTAVEQAGPLDEGPFAVPGMDFETIMQSYVDLGRTLVTDTRYFYGGLDVAADALHLNLSAQFESGSSMEKNFPAGGKKTSDLLAKLPDRGFFLAVGADVAVFKELGAHLQEWAMNLYGAALDDEARQMLQQAAKYMSKIDAYSLLLDLADPNGMVGVGIMTTGDPKGVLEGVIAEAEANVVFADKLLDMEFYSKPVEKTVEGHKVVEVMLDYSAMAEEMREAGPEGAETPNPFELMFGQDMKLTMQYAEVAGGVAMTMGAMENPILLLDDKSKLLKSDRAQAILPKLPKEAAMVGMMDTLNMVQFVANLMKGMGLPIDMPALPPSTQPPPIGFAMTTQKGIMSLDVVAPSEHIQAVATYFIQLGMQMQNAQPPVDAPQF